MILIPKHSGVQRAIREHKLDTLPMIGKGWFCMVFDKGDTVMKLTCDSIQNAFYTDAYRPTNNCFPRLINDYGMVGEMNEYNLHLVEMEKLKPIGKRADTPDNAWLQRRTLMRIENEHIGNRVQEFWHIKNPAYYQTSIAAQVLTDMSEDERLTLDLRDACEELSIFLSNFGGALDFHRANFMLRGSELVLNDVVSDIESIVCRKSRRVCH